MSDNEKQTKRPKTSHNPASLLAISQELQEHATNLSALSSSMEALGFPSLGITHNDQRVRSLEYIENFVGAVRTAIREAREQRGDFTASDPVVPPPLPTNGKRKK